MAVLITPWGKIAGQQLLFTIVNHCFLWQDHQLFVEYSAKLESILSVMLGDSRFSI